MMKRANELIEQAGELLSDGYRDDLCIRTGKEQTFLIRYPICDRVEDGLEADVYLSYGAYASVRMPLPPDDADDPYLYVDFAENGYAVRDASDGVGIIDLDGYGITTRELLDLVKDDLMARAKQLCPEAFEGKSRTLSMPTPWGLLQASVRGKPDAYPGIFVSVPDVAAPDGDSVQCGTQCGVFVEYPYADLTEGDGEKSRHPFTYHIWESPHKDTPTLEGEFPVGVQETFDIDALFPDFGDQEEIIRIFEGINMFNDQDTAIRDKFVSGRPLTRDELRRIREVLAQIAMAGLASRKESSPSFGRIFSALNKTLKE